MLFVTGEGCLLLPPALQAKEAALTADLAAALQHKQAMGEVLTQEKVGCLKFILSFA